jgi:precorrin-6B methylase 1
VTDEQQSTRGSLTVVGTGIKSIAHVTTETPSYIARADRVLYALPDWASQEWVRQQNPRAEPLGYYVNGQPRKFTYEGWVERILECLEAGENVCVVFYGHPGVFTYASHEAIRRARERGFSARMLPSVSVDGVFFADAGVDPGVAGCVSYEATDFLIRPRQVDTSTGLLLWQAGVVGQLQSEEPESEAGRQRILAEKLIDHYGPEHQVVVYLAGVMPYSEPSILCMTLSELADRGLGRLATLYVPPRQRAPLDLAMVDRLGIPRSQLDALEVGPFEGAHAPKTP